MNEMKDGRIKDLLKMANRPVNSELQRDLWPRMLQRLDERQKIDAVPWFDAALLAVVAISIIAFPHSIFLLLYHL